MAISITVLGSNSAIPAHGRHPSSQVLQCNQDYFMIDCGEGTQMQMQQFGIKKNRINHIFISHLHGDHFFGLIGMITSYNLLKRVTPLHIYASADLQKIIEIQLALSDCRLVFEIHYHHILAEEKIIFENDEITVQTVPLSHRIACVGFIFREKMGDRKLIKEQIDKYKIPVSEMVAIKKGADFVNSKNVTIANSLLTTAPTPPQAYAYISDTCFLESIIPFISGVDLLYHEATFDKSHEQRAIETFHTTTEQAATMALKAGVQKLIIGHFSAKYKNEDLQHLLEEAQTIFPATQLAEEGTVYEV